MGIVSTKSYESYGSQLRFQTFWQAAGINILLGFWTFSA